jgi:hypothetical protein
MAAGDQRLLALLDVELLRYAIFHFLSLRDLRQLGAASAKLEDWARTFVFERAAVRAADLLAGEHVQALRWLLRCRLLERITLVSGLYVLGDMSDADHVEQTVDAYLTAREDYPQEGDALIDAKLDFAPVWKAGFGSLPITRTVSVVAEHAGRVSISLIGGGQCDSILSIGCATRTAGACHPITVQLEGLVLGCADQLNGWVTVEPCPCVVGQCIGPGFAAHARPQCQPYAGPVLRAKQCKSFGTMMLFGGRVVLDEHTVDEGDRDELSLHATEGSLLFVTRAEAASSAAVAPYHYCPVKRISQLSSTWVVPADERSRWTFEDAGEIRAAAFSDHWQVVEAQRAGLSIRTVPGGYNGSANCELLM